MNARVPFCAPRAALRGSISAFDGRSVTEIPYARLADDVARACERLVRAGISRRSCVGILGDNCYPWIVYDLAILALGCVSVCLPPDGFSGRSFEELADRYDLSLLLVTSRHRKDGAPPWVLVMDGADSAPGAARPISRGALLERVQGTDVCSVIFSSGTSGKLKALLLSAAGVDAVIESFTTGWSVSADDRIFVALPLSVFQQRLLVYAALRSEARLLLTDSANLFRGFKPLQPTIVLAPPALFEQFERRFSESPPAELGARCREALGGRTRLLLTGSAPSKASTLEFYRRAELPLFQAYGMAEVGFIAWNRPGGDRALSVGRPVVPGSVSIAEDGEILVSVPSRQAVGYFEVDGDEERLTFLPDGRVATGDLGKFDGDGYLFITGRKKELILTQAGQKIHPGAIESALASVPGVERVVVLGGGELAGLIAVVAIDAGATSEQEERVRSDFTAAIRALNQRMASAPRVERFILTRVPFRAETGLLTRNLKLDRQAVYRFFEEELLAIPSR